MAKKYKKEIYTKLNTWELILFSIYLIKKNKETCTFERLVAECFVNFPEVFSFNRYPHWPDSLKLDRPLRSLREDGLIIGGAGGKYSPGEIKLTSLGESKAKETEEILNEKKFLTTFKIKIKTPRSIDEKLIYQIKTNKIFKKFLKNKKKFDISDIEFRDILKTTLETPIRILKQNLNYYKKLAENYNEKEILEFLSICEKKFIK